MLGKGAIKAKLKLSFSLNIRPIITILAKKRGET